MLKVLVIVIALAFAANATGKSKRLNNPFGIVDGIEDCGSVGRLGTVELTGCTLVPCHFIPHNIYDVSIKFTASVTSDDLLLHVYHVNGANEATLLMDLPIIGEIEAWVEYELKFQITVSTDLAGTAFTMRFFILHIDTTLKEEVCAQAPVTIGQLITRG
jgi:hypothetical protein